jgi:hypothetical protein
MGKQVSFTSGSVRDRMAVEASPNRGLNTDHSADTFGSLVVTNKVENAREVSYLVRCSICGATGQRVFQRQLEDPKFVVKCANAGCGQTSAPRVYEAGVQERLRQDAVSSPRARAEAAARAKEIENGGGE